MRSLTFVTGVFAAVLFMNATSATASLEVVRKKSPSRLAMDSAVKNNEAVSRQFADTGLFWSGISSVRPFADYEAAGYIFINDGFTFDSQIAKEAIAANLPTDMTLVVFMEDSNGRRATALKKSYGKYVPADRLKFVTLANASDGFWARDGLPVPVIEESSGALNLVDARYYYPFESDEEVGELLGSPVTSHKYNFEGGNFMANHKGHCLLVNNRSHAKIPDAIFQTLYGCKKVQRLPHVSGIGHIDEHARFVSEDTVLTDLPEYKKALEASGLKAVLLPRPQNELETYVNSVIINGVAIVPVYSEKTDQEALDVYAAAGFKAVGADSSSLSNDGEGSIHCITMTYPPVPFAKLLTAIHATELK